MGPQGEVNTQKLLLRQREVTASEHQGLPESQPLAGEWSTLPCLGAASLYRRADFNPPRQQNLSEITTLTQLFTLVPPVLTPLRGTERALSF